MSQSGRLTAQEYADIYNLYAYYNLSSDTGAPEEYAACFTPDGVMEVAGGRMLVKGRQDLTTYKRNDQAGRGGRYRRHWNGSIYLEKLADGSVRGRCYLQSYNGDPGHLPESAGGGVYEDTIVQHEREWKFARRYLVTD